MKKKVMGIIGIIGLSTIVFSTNNRIGNSESTNLNSLFSLNTVNAEDTGGGTHSCYEVTAGDLTTLVYDCSDCRQKKSDSLLRNHSICSN